MADDFDISSDELTDFKNWLDLMESELADDIDDDDSDGGEPHYA